MGEAVPIAMEAPHAEAAHSPHTLTSTLDEPILTTVWRDVQAILRKIRLVVVPVGETRDELRNWDLWGPLILCLVLAIVLSLGSSADYSKSSAFAGIFVFFWLGSGIVTLNAQLLGGTISFFQILCVLGYCLFPLVVAAVVCRFIPSHLIRIAPAGVAVVWSVYSSLGFFTGSVREQRKLLVVYPICLFYFFLAWLIVVV